MIKGIFTTNLKQDKIYPGSARMGLLMEYDIGPDPPLEQILKRA